MPINDPRIQDMDMFDLDFYEYSMICDDPKLLEKIENTYYDPEYEAWEKEFEEETQQSQAESTVELPDPDTVSWSGKSKSRTSHSSTLETEEYEGGYDAGDIDDWEKEE